MKDISKLRHSQSVFTQDDDGDLTVTYRKRSRITDTPIIGLPSSTDIDASGHNKRQLVSTIDASAKSHKFKFQLQNCTSKVKFLGWALRAFDLRDNKLDLSNMYEGATLKRLRTSSTQLLLTSSSTYLRTE